GVALAILVDVAGAARLDGERRRTAENRAAGVGDLAVVLAGVGGGYGVDGVRAGDGGEDFGSAVSPLVGEWAAAPGGDSEGDWCAGADAAAAGLALDSRQVDAVLPNVAEVAAGIAAVAALAAQHYRAVARAVIGHS